MATPTEDIFKVSILGKESIHCGFHLVPYIARTVISTLPSSTYVLFTDNNVAVRHLDTFAAEFTTAQKDLGSKSRFLSHIIAPGETSKSREGKADLEDFLLANKCTRDTVVLALGGGVIGDLVGFVAATFMRGVKFVQIPTTLLAMVDSSVGGKTAIDTPHGKNLIGAFWQPEYIFIDAAFLETLPVREFSNGMAEVVKTAAIWNEQEFISLESRSAEIFAAIQSPSTNFAGRTKATRTASQDILLSVIVGSISVKAEIVTEDPLETGLRNLVNFGHSIGHAIEAVLTPDILHGECISIGMILEAELSRQMGILNQVSVGRLNRALKAYNLPVSVHDPRISKLPASKLLSIDRLLDIMRIDKKNSGDEKKIVILSKIGATHEKKATFVRDPLIAKALAEAVKVIPGIPSHNPVTMATPGSKSISNRALVLAALGKGTCRLRNLLHSDDTQVMMNALLELKGASFSWEDAGETLVVDGGEGSLTVPPKGKELYLGNAGTAARFLTTVCTVVQSSPNDDADATIITGNARMKQRPIGPLVTALQGNGSKIGFLESEGCLPLSIAPDGFKGGHIQLAASVSSQYVSSILLCAPYAQEPVTLDLVGGQVISQPYIDMTIAMMKTFGIEAVRRVDESGKQLNVYDIPKGTYVNPPNYSIESDASSATYPLAVAAITGTTCTISNIGSSSLQGDARFAREVLERMGCTVSQTETETTVHGPPIGTLKAVEEIDMEVMTDAFLTATALAAVAGGKTRIIGIANQRVKECNRIRAMMDQLAKFGVDTIELDDGLEIIGKPIEQLRSGVSVHCYDDHRVAMAFSVLGTVVSETVLEEKRCVEKTWPNWWDDLENKIGLPVEGVELAGPSHEAFAPPPGDSSIIIIGMRGSGKSFIGALSAAALKWDCLDADEYFEKKHGQTVREYVHVHGWEAFRETETAILDELIQLKGTKHILSLGGGIVETASARETLKKYAHTKGPVVYVARPIDAIVRYLGTDAARPAYGEPITDVFYRRRPWFRECASHEFVNHGPGVETDMTESRKGTQDEVSRFFKHVTGIQPNLAPNVSAGVRSYFLSLTYPDLMPVLPLIPELSTGVDAIELRVDLLKSPADYAYPSGHHIPAKEYVWEQVASLRRVTSLPIVFTVRTVSQGGSFPDTAQKEALDFIDLAFRLGIEYVDIELSLPEKKIREAIARKGASQIIASWHDWSGKMKWNGPVVKEKYELSSKIGDIVKIVGKATCLQDNLDLYAFVTAMNARTGAKPFLAINMGAEGQLSRILNNTFTPVCHPSLPVAAAPGQLSFVQIQQALHLIGQLPPRKFYLFGSPISHSMSPAIHNTAFATLGLPYKYELLETPTVSDEIKAVITAPDFGGASVTIPHKLDIIPLLDELSPAATITGAVNTIVPKTNAAGTHILYGDNTDVDGIRSSITSRIALADIKAALLIGAGGTARAAIYAFQTMGVPVVYLFNKTRSKAEGLKEAFPEVNIQVIDSVAGWSFDGVVPNVIVSCIPAYGTTIEPRDGHLHLPSSLFSYRNGPAVVLDMAYKPAQTPLLTLAKATATNWATVTGVEALIEQGVCQSELWTKRRCPKEQVSKVVWEKFLAAA